MTTAYIFPGQGSHSPGMGAQLYENDARARELFDRADALLGFSITETMFRDSADDLKMTRVTQPAVFLHSAILAFCAVRSGHMPAPDMVAGHSLGEFSALAVNGTLDFEDALLLVRARAEAMQRCCQNVPGGMAAILGLDDDVVEKLCAGIEGVSPANYNCPGQVVISGRQEAVEQACAAAKEAGARRALPLPVSGAFHSPLMEPAREELARAIEKTPFHAPSCPVWQNVTARAESDPDAIRANLLAQLTGPVRWTASVRGMLEAGAAKFVEFGPGTVLQGLVRKIAGEAPVEVSSLSLLE